MNQTETQDLLPCNQGCGGNYDSYSFGQSDKDLTITVPLGNIKAKQLQVDIGPETLNIAVKGCKTILSGKLYKTIKSSESTWYVEDGNLFVILVKSNLKYEEWWPHVVEGETQIDMKTLVPPEINISDLDEGAQASIAKMILERQQKNSSTGM